MPSVGSSIIFYPRWTVIAIGPPTKYELLRQRLLKVFSFNGFPKADDRVDETFRRVEQKLDEGEQIKNEGSRVAPVTRRTEHRSLSSGGPDGRDDGISDGPAR